MAFSFLPRPGGPRAPARSARPCPGASPTTPGATVPAWAVPALAALALGGLSGCQKLAGYQKQRSLQEATEQQAAGHFPEAERAYEAALDGTEDTAEAHFRLALLYHEKLNDPVGAIHHLRRYLTLAPRGRYAREAKATLDRTELTLATHLSEGTLLSHAEALKLRTENNDLRRQLAERNGSAVLMPVAHATTPGGVAGSLPAAVTAGGGFRHPNPAGNASAATLAAGARAAEKDARGRTRTYTVRPGDTLASIARQFYKTKARWKDIQDANLNQLGPEPSKLRAGTNLVIPP